MPFLLVSFAHVKGTNYLTETTISYFFFSKDNNNKDDEDNKKKLYKRETSDYIILYLFLSKSLPFTLSYTT